MGVRGIEVLNLPGIVGVFSRVDRYDTFSRNTTLADGTNDHVSGHVHPLIDTRPAVQMTAFAYNRITRPIEADAALKD